MDNIEWLRSLLDMKIIYMFFNILNREQRLKIFSLVFLMVIGGVLETFSIGAFLPIVVTLSQPEFFLKYTYLIDIVEVSYNQFIILIFIILIFVFIIKNVFLLFESFLQRNFVAKSQYIYTAGLFREYLCKDYTYHLSNNSAILIRNITEGGNRVLNECLNACLKLSAELITVFVVVAFFAVIAPKLTVLCFVIGGIILVPAIRMIERRIHKNGKIQKDESEEYLKVLNHALGGIKAVKALQREEFFLKKFADSYGEYVNAINNYHYLIDAPRYIIETIVVALMSLLIIYCLSAGYERVFVLSFFTTIGVAFIRLMPSVYRMIGFLNILKNYKTLFDEIYRDLLESSKSMRRTSLEKSINDNDVDNICFNRNIKVENLSFSYDGSKKNIDDITFSIPRGAFVGIIGASGAGKTTFIDLFIGLLKPNSGCILVDDKNNIYDNLNAWKRKIAYVPQDVFLLDASIKDNVIFGCNEIDDKRVHKVVRLAGLEEFVDSLSNGIDTVVGERGAMISGGQRQRIGIARALYMKPEILVLDEATSALDNETEKEIMNTLFNLKGDITMISVAHRLSTLNNCDFKVEFKNGHITVL